MLAAGCFFISFRINKAASSSSSFNASSKATQTAKLPEMHLTQTTKKLVFRKEKTEVINSNIYLHRISPVIGKIKPTF